MNDDIQAARHLGRSAAKGAGATYMGPEDPIPDGHATLLGDWFGRYTLEMAKAYREAFNETLGTEP